MAADLAFHGAIGGTIAEFFADGLADRSGPVVWQPVSTITARSVNPNSFMDYLRHVGWRRQQRPIYQYCREFWRKNTAVRLMAQKISGCRSDRGCPAKPRDGKGIDWQAGRPCHDYFAQQSTDDWRELKTMAGKAKGVVGAFRHGTWADHRNTVRHHGFNPRPSTHHVQWAQLREQGRHCCRAVAHPGQVGGGDIALRHGAAPLFAADHHGAVV